MSSCAIIGSGLRLSQMDCPEESVVGDKAALVAVPVTVSLLVQYFFVWPLPFLLGPPLSSWPLPSPGSTLPPMLNEVRCK